MILRDRLRQLALLMPPGASVTLSRDWLLQELDQGEGGDGAPVDYTVPQIAVMFGKKPATIRKWIAAGGFEGAYLLHGKEWRIPPAGLESFRDKARASAEGGEGLGDWRQAGQAGRQRDR